MTRQSNSIEWFEKSQIDYFSIFIKLWLSFNSLYKRIYQNDGLGRVDRRYIEKLKANDNIIKVNFVRLFSGDIEECKEFKMHLQELIKKYDGGLFGGIKITRTENVAPQMNGNPLQEISFSDFIHSRSTQLRRAPNGYVKIGMMYIRNEPETIWPYYIEIMYMIRNQLVHGEMEPTDENNDIIKHCYFSLDILIKDMV